MFWFAGYEGTRQRNGLYYSIPVPTEAQRRGSFSGLPTILDPLSGEPLPKNVISADRVNKVATYFSRFFPLPTSGSQYIFSPSASFRRHQVTSLYDHYLNNNNRLFVSDTFNQNELNTPEPIVKQGGSMRRGRAQNAALNWNRTISPTMMNTLILGWSRFKNVLTSEQIGTNHTNDEVASTRTSPRIGQFALKLVF